MNSHASYNNGRRKGNRGGQFRVNFVCPDCGTHIRVPLVGFARTGWNARRFKCFKCKTEYTFHVTCIPIRGDACPPVGTLTSTVLKAQTTFLITEADQFDLAFFNGTHFRSILSKLLSTLCGCLSRVSKKVPGFSELFPNEHQSLTDAIVHLEAARDRCLVPVEDLNETSKMG